MGGDTWSAALGEDIADALAGETCGRGKQPPKQRIQFVRGVWWMRVWQLGCTE